MLHGKCPRCRGDVYLEETIDDTELVCLQCGFRQRFSLPVFAGALGVARSGRPAAR